jgi:tetratricopeptide (TPR) repeat protein
MVDDSFKDKFPQIWIVKYYNLAVCHFFYNDFNKAEEIFDKIIFDTVRKTRYYIAALEFYKGLLADLKYHRKKAERYYTMIRENKDTQYWYHFAKIFREAPVDSFMSRYIRAQNDIYVSNLKEASVLIDQIKAGFEKSPGKIKLPYLIYLTIDLEAQVQYRRRDFESAEKTYRVLSNNISHIKDDFRRDWVYIHYARVLRARKKWEEAEEMLEKAKSSGDEYTNLIVEREMFIVKTNMTGSEDAEQ